MALDIYIKSNGVSERNYGLETEDLLVDMRDELVELSKETGEVIDLYGDAKFRGATLALLEHYLQSFSDRLPSYGQKSKVQRSSKLRPRTRKDLLAVLECVERAKSCSGELLFVGD